MHMPYSGPPRAADLLPGPNKCLPNGLRNPWAPYAGETYEPAAVSASNKLQGGQVMGAPPDSQLLGGSHAGPISIHPASVATGYSGLSHASIPRSLTGSVPGYHPGGMGGWRTDDGWRGSMGRQHMGIAPDMTSVAGAMAPYGAHEVAANSMGGPPAQAGWLSPPVQQQRLSSSLGAYRQPPVDIRPRGGSPLNASPDNCEMCREVPRRTRSMSRSSADDEGQRHYRRLSNAGRSSSPLNPEPLAHKSSISRKHRRHCSEC